MRHFWLIVASLLSVTLIACDTPVVSLSEPPVKVTSESGGTGRAARPGDVVTIDYRIKLPNGELVLQASDYRFVLGKGAVIGGADDAVEGMKVGGRRVVECPQHRHWGRQGYGDGKIPPNTTLTIELRLSALQ